MDRLARRDFGPRGWAVRSRAPQGRRRPLRPRLVRPGTIEQGIGAPNQSPAVGSVLAFPAFTSIASVVVVLRRRVDDSPGGNCLRHRPWPRSSGGRGLSFFHLAQHRQPGGIVESNALRICCLDRCTGQFPAMRTVIDAQNRAQQRGRRLNEC
jgi:hypothetical protein